MGCTLDKGDPLPAKKQGPGLIFRINLHTWVDLPYCKDFFQSLVPVHIFLKSLQKTKQRRANEKEET